MHAFRPAASNFREVNMRAQKPSVRIEDWAVLQSPRSGEYKELGSGSLLVGKVFGHPGIEEGRFVFSSAVVSVDRDSQMVETRNTVYVLGQVSYEYKLWSREHGVAA
jgi:hypothetical protein